VAAQSGGTDSLPIRMTRNVLPQISTQEQKATQGFHAGTDSVVTPAA
jgi:hypothetical protein